MATHNQENPVAVTAMISVAERPWVLTRAFRSWVAAIILSATLMSGAAGAAHNGSRQEATTPPKIHELLTLLSDPKIQELLEKQGEAKAVAGSAQENDNSVEDYLNSRAGAIHEQIVALARAIPDLPNQFERAA